MGSPSKMYKTVVLSVDHLLTIWTPVPNIFGFLLFSYDIMYHILNMLKIKCDIKSARFENS